MQDILYLFTFILTTLYAYEFENGQYGKSECWYIIDAEEDAEIILGTSADSKETFENKIKEDAVLDAVEKNQS